MKINDKFTKYLTFEKALLIKKTFKIEDIIIFFRIFTKINTNH